MSPKPPTSLGLLQSRMQTEARAQGTTAARVQVVIGTTVLAQLVPSGAVKGGTAMKLRFGGATRFTRDLDIASATDAATFRRELEESLRTTMTPHPGWVPLYDEAAQGMPVRPDLDDACAWGNALIQRIDAATAEPPA